MITAAEIYMTFFEKVNLEEFASPSDVLARSWKVQCLRYLNISLYHI